MDTISVISIEHPIPLDKEMEEATRKLINRYRSVSESEVRDNNFNPASITGMGKCNSCSLCQAAIHIMRQHGPEEGLEHKGFCAYCVHHAVPEYPLTDSVPECEIVGIYKLCTADETYHAVLDEARVGREEDMVNAYWERADFLENLLKLAIKHRKEVMHE